MAQDTLTLSKVDGFSPKIHTENLGQPRPIDSSFSCYSLKLTVQQHLFESRTAWGYSVTDRKRLLVYKELRPGTTLAANEASLRRSYLVVSRLPHRALLSIDALHRPDDGRGLAVLMEYMPGGDLRSFRSGYGKKYIDVARVAKLLEPIVDAISFLHHKGVAHGAVEPSHILLDKSQRDLKLISLGAAGRMLPAERENSLFLPDNMEERNIFSSSFSDDIYGLCACFLYLIFGYIPSLEQLASQREVFSTVFEKGLCSESEHQWKIDELRGYIAVLAKDAVTVSYSQPLSSLVSDLYIDVDDSAICSQKYLKKDKPHFIQYWRKAEPILFFFVLVVIFSGWIMFLFAPVQSTTNDELFQEALSNASQAQTKSAQIDTLREVLRLAQVVSLNSVDEPMKKQFQKLLASKSTVNYRNDLQIEKLRCRLADDLLCYTQTEQELSILEQYAVSLAFERELRL